MHIDPGQMNKRIEIIRRESVRDESRYPVDKDPVVYRCWAKFSQTSGTEAIRANADFADLKVRFLIRWPPVSIDRKMLVLYNGAEYEIVYINGYGDSRQYIEIWCRWIGLARRPS